MRVGASPSPQSAERSVVSQITTSRPRPVSAECPRRGRRRDPSPRNVHVAAAASPPPQECPRRPRYTAMCSAVPPCVRCLKLTSASFCKSASTTAAWPCHAAAWSGVKPPSSRAPSTAAPAASKCLVDASEPFCACGFGRSLDVRSPRGYFSAESRRRRGCDVDVSWRPAAAPRPDPSEYPRGTPRRRRDPTPRNIHVAPRGGAAIRPLGISTWHPAAAPRRPGLSEYPRGTPTRCPTRARAAS